MDDRMQICRCKNLTVLDVKKAVKSGAMSLDAVAEITGATKACGSCLTMVRKVFEEEYNKKIEQLKKAQN